MGVLHTISPMNASPRAIAPRLALFGILTPIWLLGFATVLGATRAGYDPFRNAISELGADGSPNPLVWQIGGFAVAATLELVYAFALLREFGRAWLVWLTVAISILLFASGSAPCDPGCPAMPASGKMAIHAFAGLSVFASMMLLPIVGWRTFRARSAWVGFASGSLGVGVVLTVLFAIGPVLGPDRIGIWQRTFLTIFGTSQGVVAWRLHGRLQHGGHLETAIPGRDRSADRYAAPTPPARDRKEGTVQ